MHWRNNASESTVLSHVAQALAFVDEELHSRGEEGAAQAQLAAGVRGGHRASPLGQGAWSQHAGPMRCKPPLWL